MTRRAGARWRLLAHEVLPNPTGDGCIYGAAYNVTSDGRATPSATTTVLSGTEVDEWNFGSWCRGEQLDTGEWWINIGGVTVLVHADRDGKPRSVVVHGPGDHAMPVEGCEYALHWTAADGGAA